MQALFQIANLGPLHFDKLIILFHVIVIRVSDVPLKKEEESALQPIF